MGTLAGVKYEKQYYENVGYVASGLALIHPSDVVIASTYKGERVIAIGKHAFSGKKRFFSSLKIESGVSIIHDYAFFDCTGLKSVSIPKSVTTIGMSAFWNCSGLETMTIPNSVESIGSAAFEYNHFREVFIPKSVKKIGADAFSPRHGFNPVIYCEAETKPSGWDKKWCGSCQVRWGAKSVGDKTASKAPIEKSIRDKVQEGKLPDSHGLTMALNKHGLSYIVTGIGTCKDKIVVIPKEYEGKPVASIANRAFKGNKSIKGVIIPNTVNFLGEKAFYGCEGIEAVSIPESITFIGHGAFCGCKALTYAPLPETTKKIGVWAFKDCERLERVFIPATARFVGAGAFEGCRSLTIDCDNYSAPQEWDESWNADNRPINWMAKRGKQVL